MNAINITDINMAAITMKTGKNVAFSLKKTLTILALLGASHGLFAAGTEYPPPAVNTTSARPAAATKTQVIAPATSAQTASMASPSAQKNNAVLTNKYITQSKQLSVYAKRAFAAGDYDVSLRYSEEATKAARLSDQFATLYVKISETNSKIAYARDRLGWADTAGAQKYFPKEFFDAKEFYNTAVIAHGLQKWDEAMINADNVIKVLAGVVAPPAQAPEPAKTEGKAAAAVNSDATNKNAPLPSQYIVRPWDTFGDCFWNIAAKPWAYGNPYRWPILYNANKGKLLDPNNPNMIEPGMVMDIPSVNGEKREGMWDSGVPYSPIKKN